MNSKIYLDELQSLNEDIEPGLLTELRMDTPNNLHRSVMAEIRNEKKKKFYMNYRFYMPVAAAFLVAAIFVNGGKNFVNQIYAEKPVENVVQAPQPGQSNITPSIAVQEPAVKSNTDTTVKKDSNNIASVKPSNSSENNNKTASASKNTTTTEQNKANTTTGTGEKTEAINPDITGKDIVASSGNDQTLQNSEKDSNINLEVTASNESEVISFLKSYGTLTEDGKNKIYKLSLSYTNQLISLLENGTAESKVINGTVSGEDFVIRLVVNE